ncbi:hypothetical protein [Vibrio harveyi]|uniref:hypothetical protein n=1 Tax=Vibrio harveyi TaxID=669 RepID=UPI000A628A93|nr:hypothetical protein [Vibrio harveyi]
MRPTLICTPLIWLLTTQTLWIDGFHGTILKTQNAGQNWQSMSTPTQRNLAAICFADELNGWQSGAAAFSVNEQRWPRLDARALWQRQNTLGYLCSI